MKLKLIIGSLVLVSLGFGACSKDDDDSAYLRKDDSAYLRKDEIMKYEGSALVTIKGKSDGGYDLNETVNLNMTPGVQLQETSTSGNVLTFYMRYSQDIFWCDNSLEVTIGYNKITKVSKVSRLVNSYEKNIDAKTILGVYDDYSDGWYEQIDLPVLTDFIYNTETGIVKGYVTYTSNYKNAENLVLSHTITVDFTSNVKVVVD